MISFTEWQANKYRDIMNKAAESLSDSDAAYAPRLFEQWAPGVEYPVGRRVCYIGRLYKVLIAHKSQDSWAPDISPSLFAEVLIPDSTEIYDWVQPGSTNPYMQGDKVRHNDKIWISTIDNNIWEPGVYGWEEVV